MAQYTKTVRVTDFDLLNVGTFKPGQWVTCMGARGQFLGVTASGSPVIRWQKETSKFGQGSDSRADARANGILRKYAKNYGSK